MKQTHQHSPIFTLAILSISLITMSSSTVSATIPAIGAVLDNYSHSAIELLISISNIGILIFALLTPALTRHFGNKAVVMAGLMITLITGVIPMFTAHYQVLLISRFLLGCGIGLFNSLAYSLISIYYTGATRDRLMGFQAAVASFGATFMTIAVAGLINISWQVSFSVYTLALIPILLFGLFVPNDQGAEIKASNQQINIAKHAVRVEKTVVIIALYLLVEYIAFGGLLFKLATLFVEEGIGTESQASIVLSLNTAASFFSGLIFGHINKLTKGFVAPLSLALFGLTTLLIGYVSEVWPIAVLITLGGIFSGFIKPALFSKAAAVSNGASQTLVSAILLVCINLGMAFSPTVFSIIVHIFNDSSAQFAVMAAGVILIISAVALLFTIKGAPAKSRVISEYI